MFKTPEVMLEYAVNIANNDPLARVCMVLDRYLAEDVFNKLAIIVTSSEYKHFKGGRIKFIHPVNIDVVHYMFSGLQFTHLFITELGTDIEVVNYLKSRIRFTNYPVEPSGVYWPHGVERWSSY